MTIRRWPVSTRTIEQYRRRHIEFLTENYTQGYIERFENDFKQDTSLYTDNDKLPVCELLEADHYELDELEAVLFDVLGHQHGECINRKCKDSTMNLDDVREWIAYTKEDDEYPPRYTLIKSAMEEVRENYGEFSYDHSHIGDWELNYILKTGYDFGFCKLLLKDEETLQRIKIKYVLGENWEII